MNNCSQTIYVGIQSSVMSGGFKLASGDTHDITVPIGWNSGTIWARTNCNFNSSNVCAAAGPNNVPPANCCDTGGCTDSTGKFALDCENGPAPPVTIAEFTVDGGNNRSDFDTYDVSMVSGGNVSVSIEPLSSTYDINPGIDPNGTKCSTDSDCNQATSFTRCVPTLGCVNPFYCASPGCSNSSGCSAPGLEQSLLPPSPWGGSESDFAIPTSSCPSELQFMKQKNQGTGYVGCMTPQKFCRTPCKGNNNCPAPFTCGQSGFCVNGSGVVIGADCDTTSIPCTRDNDCVNSSGDLPGTCDSTANTCTGGTATSFNDLWGCTNVNSHSCFTEGADANCCGCPPWVQSSLCTNNNPEWQTVAEPIFEVFHNAAPTAYSFPYDDKLGTYTCGSGSTGNVTAYNVVFCPQESALRIGSPSPGGKATGGGCSIAPAGSKPAPLLPLYLLVPVFILIRRSWRR